MSKTILLLVCTFSDPMFSVCWLMNVHVVSGCAEILSASTNSAPAFIVAGHFQDSEQ